MIMLLIVDDYFLYCDVLKGVLLLLLFDFILLEVGDFIVIVDIL